MQARRAGERVAVERGQGALTGMPALSDRLGEKFVTSVLTSASNERPYPRPRPCAMSDRRLPVDRVRCAPGPFADRPSRWRPSSRARRARPDARGALAPPLHLTAPAGLDGLVGRARGALENR